MTYTRAALLPRHDIYLYVEDADTAKRFADLFRATWKQIPLPARRALLKHWRAGRDQLLALCEEVAGRPVPRSEVVFPSIKLSTDWAGRVAGDLGACTVDGSELNFHVGAFNLMPDAAAAAVIAHELCHAVFAVQGRRFASAEEEEQEVPRFTAEWGFDNEALDKWMRTSRPARKAAGVLRCGWCDIRDVPDEDAPQSRGPSGWERVCLTCAAERAVEAPP